MEGPVDKRAVSAVRVLLAGSDFFIPLRGQARGSLGADRSNLEEETLFENASTGYGKLEGS